MEILINGIIEGLRLLFTGDPALWEIILLSAQVSGIALLFSAMIGVPLGAFLGFVHYPGERIVRAIIYTGMGLPPVVAGLAVYLLLSRSGILAPLKLPFVPPLFTVPAMVIAQVLIASPLVIGYTMSAVANISPNLKLQVRALGATKLQIAWVTLKEARRGVLVALVGGMGSIISEVGAVTMVGGNIQNSTRVLTSAIMQETRQGNFDMAIGLGIVLLLLSFVINFFAAQLQGKT